MPEETHLNSYNSFNHTHRTVHNKSRNEYKLPTNSAREAMAVHEMHLVPKMRNLQLLKLLTITQKWHTIRLELHKWKLTSLQLITAGYFWVFVYCVVTIVVCCYWCYSNNVLDRFALQTCCVSAKAILVT